MARNSFHDRAEALNILSARIGLNRNVMIGNVTIDADGPLAQCYDPNGSDRTITLPSLLDGGGSIMFFSHVGSANRITIQAPDASTISYLDTGQSTFIVGTETEYVALRAWADLDDFGYAGPDHHRGLVPDPGPTPGVDETHRRFLGELGWQEISELSGDDFFKYFTDGTNTATPVGADTFKIRSSDSTILVTVTNNDVTHGDNVNLVVVESNVDHDLLLNYVADEHVAHTGVTITAGIALSGGGTIAASRTIDWDPQEPALATPGLGDTHAFFSDSDGAVRKATLSSINAVLVHDSLNGFVANEHIDHSLVSITGTDGIAGGGDLTASRTLQLAFDDLDIQAIASADILAFYDASQNNHSAITFLSFNQSLDHDVLVNFVADEHIAHSGVSISGDGTSITGGGDITASRVLTRAALTGDATASAGSNATTVVSASTSFALTGVISPSQITSNQNDYAPTGHATASFWRLSSDASRNITSIAGGATGRIIVLHNVGAQNIVLTDDDGATGTAANRLALTANITMTPDSVVVLMYDATTQRWRAISGGGGSSFSGGRMEVWIDAGSMTPRKTNGAQALLVETATNKRNTVVLAFDASTQEFAQFHWALPKSWNEGTVTFIPYWSHPSTTTNFGVVWGLAGIASSNDDALDTAVGTAQTSTDTGGTTSDIYEGPECSAITIAGSPAEGDYVTFEIHRDPSNGSDTMAVDAYLHGILLVITTDAGTDA